MSNSKVKGVIVSVVVLLGAAAALYVTQKPQAPAPAVPIAGTAQKSESESSGDSDGAVLKLGTPQRQAHQIRVPVHVTLPTGKKVGSVQAQIQIPPGPWVFESATAPDGAEWDFNAEKSSEEGGGADGQSGTALDVNADAGSRALRSGLLGFLIFTAQTDATPQSIAGTVADVQTSPPQAAKAQGQGKAGSDEVNEVAKPPVNPALGCFFFSH